jgi:uncharacterized protein YndB with AHSA1/START domain
LIKPTSDELALHFERILDAPRSVVFAMFTEPDRLTRWWGPTGFTVSSISIDPRVGGTYRIEMQPPDGDAFSLSGKFRDVDPPARLSYTFAWEDPDPDDRETVVSVSLADLGASTQLTIDQGVFATDARRSLHDQGWTETLDRLEAVLTDDASP